MSTGAGAIYGPAHDPFNPEHRLLNMRERAALRDAHRFAFWTASGRHHGACLCGHALPSSFHAHEMSAAARLHFEEVCEFARGRKVAEAKARDLARLDAAVEDALWSGLAAERRAAFRAELGGIA